MRILGIGDSHDSGVCLIEDGKILYAANEERFSRVKLDRSFPRLSLENLFNYTKLDLGSIDLTAVASFSTFTPMQELPQVDKNSNLSDFFLKTEPWTNKIFNSVAKLTGPLVESTPFINLFQFAIKPFRANKEKLRGTIEKWGIRMPVKYVEHHTCHAASAYFTSGFREATVITLDGSGDGLSGSISVGRDGCLRRIGHCPKNHSAGNFWGAVTLACGFIPDKHGGKITGLAAYKPSQEAHRLLREFYGYSKERLHFIKKSGAGTIGQVRLIKKVLKDFSREEIAYAAQKVLEETITGIVRDAVEKTGKRNVCLAGGVFSNVRLNQKIAELEDIDQIFIHPHMGDGGLAVGAALYTMYDANLKGLAPFTLEDVYLGPEYNEYNIMEACKNLKMRWQRLPNYAAFIADCLVQKKIVGIYHGRMEYGPRALGHRSILGEPTDPSMMDWLNKKLARTEFMPFAPVILEEKMPMYFKNYEKGRYAARFMTICFDVTDYGKKMAPGIVHVDGTARPQIVNMKNNKYIYKILVEYEKKTGLPLCVNTSFNRHEEPIVCTPSDAIEEFLRGGVDVLVMDDYHIYREE